MIEAAHENGRIRSMVRYHENHFQFLLDVRETGRINMMAAARPLLDNFPDYFVDLREAEELLLFWISNFKAIMAVMGLE